VKLFSRAPVLSAALLLMCGALVVVPAGAQQEQGDIELQFTGSLLSTTGRDDVDFTSGVFQAKVGYFVTDRVEIGAFPSFFVTRVSARVQGSQVSETATRLGMGIFTTYSFLTADAATVPYLGAQFYRIDLTDDDETGWVGANAGIKYFFSRSTAFDIGGNLLTGLGERGGTLFLFQVGLSFLL
jgi:hypothetical protein